MNIASSETPQSRPVEAHQVSHHLFRWKQLSHGEGPKLRCLWVTLEAIRAAALLSLAFRTPRFYITSVLPGSTSWAGAPEEDPRLRYGLVTPNLIVAAVFVLMTVTGVYSA